MCALTQAKHGAIAGLVIGKIVARVREGGVSGLAKAAAERVVEKGRAVVLLSVDLTEQNNLLREKDRAAMAAESLSLTSFDRTSLPRVREMLEKEAPERIASAEARLLQGMSGFVFEKHGAVIGYVFWVPGADDPRVLVHRDLEWLGLEPKHDEVYVFDYFVPENARGHTSLLVRAVQAEHAALGFKKAYGYVYLANRPALWTYRTTGWKEIGRIEEHRILNKVAVVKGQLYWMHAWSRTKLGSPLDALKLLRR